MSCVCFASVTFNLLALLFFFFFFFFFDEQNIDFLVIIYSGNITYYDL